MADILCSYVVRGWLFRHRAWPYHLAWHSAWSGTVAAGTDPPCYLKDGPNDVPPGNTIRRRRVRCYHGDHTTGCDTIVETFKPATQIGWLQRNQNIDGVLYPCPTPRRFEPGAALWQQHCGPVNLDDCNTLAPEGGVCVGKVQSTTIRRHGFRFSRQRPVVNVDGTYGAPGKLRVYMLATTAFPNQENGCCHLPGGAAVQMTADECAAAGGTFDGPGTPCIQ